MRSILALALLLVQLPARWNEGATDCAAHPQPPLAVHAYDPQTYVLRESLCATFEAPFMYLLIGSDRALLIDDGDVADPHAMPLADSVMHLIPGGLPLLVVHTHRHLDHRSADSQFVRLPRAQVVGYDLESVKRFYHFTNWPDGVAQIDLGNRTVDVIPTPGHNETHVVFYDRNTGLLFSGDFLMPGRLLIDDATADLASAKRVADFVANRNVTYALGGHIEIDSAGNTFAFGSHYHPHEHVLQLSKADVLALPAAVARFNGFYTQSGQFIMLDQIRVLIAEAIGAALVLTGVVVSVARYIRRRRRGVS